MLNQNQTQNQTSYQSYPTEQQNNSYPKSQRKDSNTNNPLNPKYTSNKSYQSPQEQRKNSLRERSRSGERSPRQSFHEYNQGNQNNSFNNRKSKPYHYRTNNDRPYNLNLNKRDSYSGNFNNNFTPSKDDCLLIFQKNYFEFDSKDFGILKSELKRELKEDIYNIYYNFCINDISDKIFRFTTNPSVNYPCKSKAVKIICDFLFHIMKQQNDKVTYLKLLFVIPNNVVGFIIGMNGKNINQIRDETNTKIEVYAPGNSKNYRKIEISGGPQNIADASEKIFEISKRYFYFNNEKILNRNEQSPQREKSWERDRNRDNRDNRDQGYGMNNYKDRERNDRYHEGNWNNRDYDNNPNSKDFRGVYNNRDSRNDYRDTGYKNREGNRMYGGRDMKNSRDNWEKNNYSYNNKDNNNYRDYRNNGPRFKNNYDRENNNNKYYYKKNNNERDNNDNYNNNNNNNNNNRDSFSERSFSKKSLSQKSKENKSYNNEKNEDELPEERDNKNEINIRNENQNLEPGEEIDFKDSIDNNANNINILKENLLNENATDNNKDNINKNLKDKIKEEKKKKEIDEIKEILAKDVEENDKICKIVIYLSSEEINILNNTKSENDNIWINLENSFHCSISKINKIIEDKEYSLITFNGTPKQNTLAIYKLQTYLSDF